MSKKSRNESPVLDWVLGLLFLLIAALAMSAAVRVGPQAVVKPKQPIRIQLWNGSGRAGLAAELASYLRDGGFDVLEVANADRSDYRATLVVNRGDNPDPARVVAEYLGTSHVIQQVGSQEMIDVTVIVGRDARRWTQPH
ncbi:MAG: LytR family transcriptional regulator [Candidatus Eisenbacteria bacterium]|uniref:LytR family transcriptional regulator n=1 Tax=Eiseniibacteriota bacterium TaxID=2212470 RepID=A0A538TAK6_UNCEI|nr:MAG: LytR family transcriptional regulator [Candidatus Eisenbacteria bacterium]